MYGLSSLSEEIPTFQQFSCLFKFQVSRQLTVLLLDRIHREHTHPLICGQSKAKTNQCYYCSSCSTLANDPVSILFAHIIKTKNIYIQGLCSGKDKNIYIFQSFVPLMPQGVKTLLNIEQHYPVSSNAISVKT